MLRGSPQTIISDKGKIFKPVAEKLMNYLGTQAIKWKFDSSKVSCWGGMFESLISIKKKSLTKILEKDCLFKLKDALLDLQCLMNNRMLCYQEEETHTVVPLPNVLMRGKPVILLDENLKNIK